MPKRPKIIQYCPTGPIEKGWAGGIDIYVLQILEGLDRDKYEVEAFCFYDGFFAQGCREKGIPCSVFARTSKYDVTPLWQAVRYLKSETPDIIHTHGNFIGTAFGFLPTRFTRKGRIVHTIHTFTEDEVGETALRRLLRGVLDRWIVKSASHVYTVAEMQLRKRLFRGIPRDKLSSVRVCLEPFDIDSVDDTGARDEFGIAPGEIVFTNVGRLTAQKGIGYLLEAAKIVVAEHPASKFVIVGKGDLEDTLKAQAQSLGLSDRVVFAGFRTDIHRLLKMSDVFVMSSVYEGMPKAILEAMMAKLPCVCTGIFGIPELLGDTGLLVPPRDSKSLADGLLRVARDPDLRGRLGDAAKRRVETEFNQKIMLSRIEEIYDKVLSGRQSEQ